MEKGFFNLKIYSEEEETSCSGGQTQGDIVFEAGKLDDSLLWPGRTTEELKEILRLRNLLFGEERKELDELNSARLTIEHQKMELEMANQRVLEETQDKLNVRGKLEEVIRGLEEKLALAMAILGNQSTQLEDLEAKELERESCVAQILRQKQQQQCEKQLENAQKQVSENQKLNDKISQLIDQVATHQRMLDEANQKLTQMSEDNVTLRKKLQLETRAAQCARTRFREELTKCYQKDMKTLEDNQKLKEIIKRIQHEMDKLKTLCDSCKRVHVNEEIKRLKGELVETKKDQQHMKHTSIDATHQRKGPNPTKDYKCECCGDQFRRSLDVADYLGLLVVLL